MRDSEFVSPITLSGAFRTPVQLLDDQQYDGHGSIHDSSVAKSLGFEAGAIEGPVHFSQFAPLLVTLWGMEWVTSGCISVHYSAPCTAGEEVRAFAEVLHHGARSAKVWMTKRDGTLVLTGSATLEMSGEGTEARARLERVRAPTRLRIIDQLVVGHHAPTVRVRIDPEVALGELIRLPCGKSWT